jgi:alkanesulfonate monooxygenase SsuD/methylene tetrahydromethanopterin reductase-like flavin-dependent oxidoreductase (luciferase family)
MTDVASSTRPGLVIRYDLRSPSFARPHSELYAAMMEQTRWAERVGFDSVVFSEHHAAADGYLPSPLVTAAAVAGATTRIRISVSALLLPLYDVVRVAEDMAVLDLVSNGRVDLVIGAGYRPEEYELHQRSYRGRVRAIEDGIAFLRRAWTGEPFEHEGRTVHITPAPLRSGGPMIFLGGSSVAAARRAARIADGFFPVVDSLANAYIAACAELGKQPGPSGGPKGPMFVHVSEDPDQSWARIAPHALHETNSYGQWLSAAGNVGPYAEMADADALRASGNYVVMTPDQCIKLAREQGSLTLHPLMGGLDPDVAAESLELVETKVLPELLTGS